MMVMEALQDVQWLLSLVDVLLLIVLQQHVKLLLIMSQADHFKADVSVMMLVKTVQMQTLLQVLV